MPNHSEKIATRCLWSQLCLRRKIGCSMLIQIWANPRHFDKHELTVHCMWATVRDEQLRKHLHGAFKSYCFLVVRHNWWMSSVQKVNIIWWRLNDDVGEYDSNDSESDATLESDRREAERNHLVVEVWIYTSQQSVSIEIWGTTWLRNRKCRKTFWFWYSRFWPEVHDRNYSTSTRV